MDTNTYNVWSIILWGGTLLAGGVTVIIYYRQLRAMQETIRAQNLAGLIQYLQSPEVRHARHVVIGLKGMPYAGGGRRWSEGVEQEASTACAAYVVTGILVQLNRVDRDVIIANWGPSIRLVYNNCREFIEARRKESGDPRYWRAFDWLYEQVESHHGEGKEVGKAVG